jgi:SAM-dependent methyltransferase
VFRYYHCSSCRVIFLSPVPPDLGRYYPPDYHAIPASLTQLQVAAGAERYKLDLVRRFHTAGRLLEVGPSAGAFAYLAKNAGFEVDTIEIDPASCRFLRETVGVRAIESGRPSEAMRALPSYAVIALWHVIEHIPDPWQTLAAAAEHLVPGGVVVIGAPNPHAFQRLVFGQYWTHIDAPRHLQLLPLDALSHRAESLGLRPRLVTTRHKGDLGWNQFGWQKSIDNLFRAYRVKGPSTMFGWWLTLLALPIERTGRGGSTYTAVFQKDAP